MNFLLKLLIIFLFPSFLMAQSSFWKPADSLNKARIITSSSIIGVGYAGSLIGLQQVWYNNPWTDFHFFKHLKITIYLNEIPIH